MVVLILGGSGSGKSEFAENYVCSHFPAAQKYYIATMEVYGEEGHRRVERHRKLRAGKGFETLEQCRDVGLLANQIAGQATLLECMSNLVANEMFSGEENMTDQEQCPQEKAERVTKKVLEEIDLLGNAARELVIVTNNVFEDGVEYPPETKAYLQALGEVNRRLADRADVVAELVVGIPVWWKGKL